jgi:hypothetical protein
MAERRRRFFRDNGLSLVFIAMFVAAVVGQAVAGWHDFNSDQVTHHQQTYGFLRYIFSSDFGSNLLDNWQSEFLQFAAFIALGVWLRQRGSTESTDLDGDPSSDEEQQLGAHTDPNSPLWARAGGWRTAVFSHSLLALMLALWLASWAAASITSWSNYNDQQQEHKEATLSYGSYLTSSNFWDLTLQNWQSEFLAVASISIFSVFLRERGSPQSKPVGAPHEATGVSP